MFLHRVFVRLLVYIVHWRLIELRNLIHVGIFFHTLQHTVVFECMKVKFVSGNASYRDSEN